MSTSIKSSNIKCLGLVILYDFFTTLFYFFEKSGKMRKQRKTTENTEKKLCVFTNCGKQRKTTENNGKLSEFVSICLLRWKTLKTFLTFKFVKKENWRKLAKTRKFDFKFPKEKTKENAQILGKIWCSLKTDL